jgi:hypothetical protein
MKTFSVMGEILFWLLIIALVALGIYALFRPW